jgi:hypothetical protein
MISGVANSLRDSIERSNESVEVALLAEEQSRPGLVRHASLRKLQQFLGQLAEPADNLAGIAIR